MDNKDEQIKLLEGKLQEFRKEFNKNNIKKNLCNIYMSMHVDRYNYLKTL